MASTGYLRPNSGQHAFRVAFLLAALASGGMLLAKPAEPGPTDENAPEEFTATKSGLKYRIRRASEGDRPRATDRVTVHYRGWLDDGTEFDSSYKRGKPATFRLRRVIRCWTEGLQMMKVGGKARLVCPPKIAYGVRGKPPRIPPNSTLTFEVELLEIKSRDRKLG